ncbi:hypothetical protein BMS3Abin10_02455 [bacterium BMS3Abin10]|nr:hypothetical protein BMS3Abin10_02455 [bacterium BMS3Abin10]HDZ62633.1 hypothetical protein [Nitrospirota bacterium]
MKFLRFLFLLLTVILFAYSCGGSVSDVTSTGGTGAGPGGGVTAGAGSIEFDSATPVVIAIRGTAGNSTSLVKFIVDDSEGAPAANGISVDFVMTGPGGNEYIGEQDATPTTASTETVGGYASVYLNSGFVAGSVNISATVTGTALTAAASTISIGGDVPNDDHLTLARLPVNLEGLEWTNIQSTVSAFLADRYGNYNILEGTSLSFKAEAGAIDTSAVTDAYGEASVMFRTQDLKPEDVAPVAWENALCAALEATYGIDFYDGAACQYGHPRDGYAAILLSTTGEEAFDDLNANGVFDPGEFTAADHDTMQEAFLDVNGDGCWNDGATAYCPDGSSLASADPFEIYIDDNWNSAYDWPPNGVWDAGKTIFRNTTILISGGPAYIVSDLSSGFAVGDSSSITFNVMVSDINLNPLISGSTVAVSASVGTLTGITSYTFPDTIGAGPVEFGFMLEDANPGDTDAAEITAITVKVTWKGIESTVLITGTVD